MSTTPATNAPCYLSLNPEMRYVTLGTANLPSTLTANVVQNRAGLQDAVIQATASKQPGWSSNAISGTYLVQNGPGANAYPLSAAAGTSALVGVPGFTFNGTSQFFEYDTLASQFSGTEIGITVICVVQCTSAGAGPLTVWSLSSASGTTALSLSYQSGSVVLTTTNGSTTASVGSVSTNLAVVSATRISNAISLRIWYNVAGVPTLFTGTHSISPISETYTTFAIGAQVNTPGTGTNFFNGNVGKLGVYGVPSGTTIADIENLEAEWLLSAGISRTQDLATSAAAGTLEA